MWERLVVDEEAGAEGSVLLVALSTMAPQYEPLYSHARELSRFLLRKLEFRKFATLYSSALPSDVAIGDDGIVRLRSNSFYSSSSRKRVIMLAGDGSPLTTSRSTLTRCSPTRAAWGRRRWCPSAHAGRSLPPPRVSP